MAKRRRDSRAAGRKLASYLVTGSGAVFFLSAFGVRYFNVIPPIMLAMLFGLGVIIHLANREIE